MDWSPAALARDGHVERRREFDGLVASYAHMVRTGLLPPDDAYHWTRYVVREARLISLCDLDPYAPES